MEKERRERERESENDEQLSRHGGTFTSIHGIADVSKWIRSVYNLQFVARRA